jgi:hypothetical protein
VARGLPSRSSGREETLAERFNDSEDATKRRGGLSSSIKPKTIAHRTERFRCQKTNVASVQRLFDQST